MSVKQLRSTAKVNLRERFAALQQESSSSASASPKPKAEPSSKFGITADIIDGYSDKINAIYKNASKLDSDTIFYGRNATHENLFQKEEEEEPAPVATSRRTQQKNRSGRSVNPSSICVNMAHVLLNVDNENPLSKSRPHKQESPFKMKKLLRHHMSTRKRVAARAVPKSVKKVKIDPDAIKQEAEE
uniref:Uncharacterized protein n=1 Tax=Steinernema glaseri TaxID=37863 RepID=A0A1I7Y6A9_9BILA